MTDRSESDPIYALLPWYANGTLSDAERQNIELALAADPALRQTLARIEEERAETIALNETIAGPVAGGFDRLMARIEAEAPRPDRSQRYNTGILSRLLEGIGRLSPASIAYAGAALVLVLVAQSGALIGLLWTPQGSGLHQIAAATPSPEATGEAIITVQFVPGATLDVVAALLNAEQASITSGPDAGGLFKLAVPAARADTVIADLLAHKNLVLMARAAG